MTNSHIQYNSNDVIVLLNGIDIVPDMPETEDAVQVQYSEDRANVTQTIGGNTHAIYNSNKMGTIQITIVSNSSTKTTCEALINAKAQATILVKNKAQTTDIATLTGPIQNGGNKAYGKSVNPATTTYTFIGKLTSQ